MSGASSKSFVDRGRLDLIRAAIRPGDTLLISFGHNDEKAGYATASAIRRIAASRPARGASCQSAVIGGRAAVAG
jgi:lysophospholipase L1-like esterase